MKFGIVQKDKFKAVVGSYSIVTAREIYDSQITATDCETELLKRYYQRRGETIYHGNVNSNRTAAAKSFRLYPSGKTISLNLVYPKPLRSELRLYISSRAGFMPKEGDVWFLFVSKQNELWIGAMPEKEWRAENSIYRNGEEIVSQIDSTVQTYRETVHRMSRPSLSRKIVDKRLRLSKYKCEFDSAHKLFIAKATGCPYLEVHHIIPYEFRKHYKSKNLDSLNNLCCLCPNCHAAVHHADEALTREMLTVLSERRAIPLHFHVSKEELFRLYSVENIVR